MLLFKSLHEDDLPSCADIGHFSTSCTFSGFVTAVMQLVAAELAATTTGHQQDR